MTVLAIDPGTVESGFVILDEAGIVKESGKLDNARMLRKVQMVGLTEADTLAIEMIASYGMPVGKEVFQTCVWVGRFMESWPAPEQVKLIYRKDVKLELCGTARAKDPNVRQALIDRVGPPGTKKQPGPTYGVKGDAWAALGVAVVAAKAA